MNNQNTAIDRFRELHQSGCFVLPNPWDVGSAVYLEHLGFKALATTSAGFAFSKGMADGPGEVSRDLMLDHFREIAAATSLPVNADYQNVYADEPEGVMTNVRLCIETGVAGLSIEDNTGRRERPLYDFSLSVERVKAARAAVDASGKPVVLTARCEAYLVGDADPLRTSLDRLTAFADAGADCLYAPGVSKFDQIAAIVKAVAPQPVNVLVSSHNSDTTVKQLADLGVRRISLGGILARVAWGAFVRSARAVQETGTFTTFANAEPFAALEEVFRKRKVSRA